MEPLFAGRRVGVTHKAFARVGSLQTLQSEERTLLGLVPVIHPSSLAYSWSRGRGHVSVAIIGTKLSAFCAPTEGQGSISRGIVVQ